MSATCDSNQNSSQLDISSTSADSQTTFLTPGTAVSAKYRGAFCEATVDQVDLRFRLRIQLKSSSKHVLDVDQTHFVSGEPKVGASVVVRVPSSSSSDGRTGTEKPATVLRVVDYSLYTVVFDDGDKRTLRRTQLVIKGERHFKESESLDCLPLTNPEQFRQPVIDRRRTISSDCDENEDDSADDWSSHAHSVPDVQEHPSEKCKSKQLIDHERNKETCTPLLDRPIVPLTPVVPAITTESSKGHPPASLVLEPENPYHRLLGRLVLVELTVSGKDVPANSNDSNTSLDENARRRFPALVVLPSAMPSIDLRPTPSSKSSPLLLVRSFKDNRFFPIPTSHVKRLKRAAAVELAHKYSASRAAVERALLWLDRYELPAPWGENAMQSLLGTKDWRSTKRAAHRVSHPTVATTKPQSSRKCSSSKFSKSATGQRPRWSTHSSSDDDVAPLPTSKNKSPTHNTKSSLNSGQNRKRSRISGHTSNVPQHNPKPKRPRLKKSAEDIRQQSTLGSRSELGKTKPATGKKAEQSSDGSNNQTLSSVSTNDSPIQSRSPTDHHFSADSDSDQSTSSSVSSFSSSSSTSSSSVEFEARDRWIAQLYRFMDEGGTPINKAPSLANKDLDLYKLYKLVRQLGGFHRVTTQMKWGYIYSKLRLPHHFAAGPRNLQSAFKRYLYPLDDASRKLGTDLDALPLSRPRHIAPSSTATANPSTRPTTTTARNTMANQPTITISSSSQPKSTPVGLRRPDKAAVAGPTSKPVLTAKDSVWQPVTQPLESSPPVLSPPILSGTTPSPPGDGWAPSSSESEVKSSVSGGGREPVSAVKRRRMRDVRLTPSSIKESAAPISTEKVTEKVSDKRAKSPDHSLPVTARREPMFLNELKSKRCPKTKRVIPIGSLVRVQCGENVAYEAKVLRHIRPHPPTLSSDRTTNPESKYTSPVHWSTSSADLKYRIHYTGWNMRHDEVVSRSRIISVVEWARPVEIHRPPSCSSLNFVVQEASNWASGSADVRRSATSSTSSEAPSKKRKELSAIVRKARTDEQDRESDYSQTTETASDIVTTMAPTIRHRRFMFDKNRLSQHRSKHRPQRTTTNERSLTQPASRDPVESVGKIKQTSITDASSDKDTHVSTVTPIPYSSRRARPPPSVHTSKPSAKEPSTSDVQQKTDQPHPKPVQDKLEPKSDTIKSTAVKSNTEQTTSRKPKVLSKSPASDSPVKSPQSSRKLSSFSERAHASRTTPVIKSSNHHETSDDRPRPHSPSKSPSVSQSKAADQKTIKPVLSMDRKKQISNSEPQLMRPTLKQTTERHRKLVSMNNPSVSNRKHSADVNSPTEKVEDTTTSQSKSDVQTTTGRPEAPSSGGRESSEDSHSPRNSLTGSGPGKFGAQDRSAPRTWEDSNSGSDSDTSGQESSASGYGALDALPRLTRSQHRQLLGDTPPGAALRTASPVVIGEASLSEGKIEGALSDKDSRQNIPANVNKTDSPLLSDEQFVPPTSVIEAAEQTRSTSESMIKVENEQTDQDRLVPVSEDDITSPRRSIQLRPRGIKPLVASDPDISMEGTQFTKSEPKELSVSDACAEKPENIEEDEEEMGSQASVHTLSTDPMKDSVFELPLSPSQSSSSSNSPTFDLPAHGDSMTSQQQPMDNLPSSEEELDVPTADRLDSMRKVSTEPTPVRSPINVRSRVRRASNSSTSETPGSRKTKKKVNAAERNQAIDGSPTSVPCSPHLSRSPYPASDSVQPESTTPQPAGPTRQAPLNRRFGGPYLPIPGYEDMSSEMRCLHLQERMHRILEAWRSAKQYLKELEQRSNKTRRLRSKESKAGSTQQQQAPPEAVSKESRSMDSVSAELPPSNSLAADETSLICS